MQDNTARPRSKCAYCGEDITTDSIRNPKVKYCSRPCASMSRYQKRYVGPRSGQDDKPKTDRTKL